LGWVLLPIAAFLPGLLWLWYFYSKDIYRPEPKGLIALTFFLGAVASAPAGLLELVFVWLVPLEMPDLLDEPANISVSSGIVLFFFVVGPIEEGAKLLAVRLGPYRSSHFDEPLDGIIYASAVALGFASLETLAFAMAVGWEVILLRAVFSFPAHLLFSAVWGNALGWAKFYGGGRTWAILRSFF